MFGAIALGIIAAVVLVIIVGVLVFGGAGILGGGIDRRNRNRAVALREIALQRQQAAARTLGASPATPTRTPDHEALLDYLERRLAKSGRQLLPSDRDLYRHLTLPELRELVNL